MKVENINPLAIDLAAFMFYALGVVSLGLSVRAMVKVRKS